MPSRTAENEDIPPGTTSGEDEFDPAGDDDPTEDELVQRAGEAAVSGDGVRMQEERGPGEGRHGEAGQGSPRQARSGGGKGRGGR